MVANVPTTDSLSKRYGAFSGWGMAAGKVKVLLVVSVFDVDRGAEARLVNKDVNIQEGDMGRIDGPNKSDRIASIVALLTCTQCDSFYVGKTKNSLVR